MKYVMAIVILLILIMGCAPVGNTATDQPKTPVVIDNTSTHVPPAEIQPTDNTTSQVVPTATDHATSLKVLFDRQGKMYSTSIDGSEVNRVSKSSDMSPDGKTYVFAKITEYNNYRWLYFTNSDKTKEWPIFPVGGGGADYAFPVWSPDGSKIAFSKSNTSGASAFLTYDVWIINPDGTSPKKISGDTNPNNPRSQACPQWFPDSKKIAYASNEEGYWQIFYTPIGSYEPHLIVKLQQKFSPGRFPWDYAISQDGKRMIYKDGPGTDLKMLVIDLNSKKIMEWPNIDTSDIAPIISEDGAVTIITKSDGLYYTYNSHKEPIKILSTDAGDIAIKVEVDLENLTSIKSPAAPVEIMTPKVPLLVAPLVDIKTSFDAVTYTNETNGFLFKYPKGWVTGKSDNGHTIYVLSGESKTSDRVWVDVIPETTDLASAVKDSYDSSPTLVDLNKVVKIESSKVGTLSDGKTPCKEVVVSSQLYSGITLYGIAVGINKGGKTVFVTGATIYPGDSEARIREIVRTLTIK